MMLCYLNRKGPEAPWGPVGAVRTLHSFQQWHFLLVPGSSVTLLCFGRIYRMTQMVPAIPPCKLTKVEQQKETHLNSRITLSSTLMCKKQC